MEELLRHFQNVQSIIQRNKAGALLAANSYMLSTYWEVGAYLSHSLTERIYGAKVVDKLAGWLQNQEPGIKGFDRRSLYRMRDFFETWITVDWAELNLPKHLITNPFLDLSEKTLPYKTEIVGSVIPQSPPLPMIISRITWTHHLEILKRTISQEERLFYLFLTVRERYKVRELGRQIKSGLFERQMLAKHTLLVPEHPKKELLPEVFRDRYILEFLDLKEPYSEFDLKKALIAQMKKFLLELGRDFLFIDEEMHLKVGMNDYFVDLVFLHRELQCLVAFDLKIEEFKPEHLGKMNFYLELLDRDIRKPHENPSIGVVLCKTKNDEVVEIAMSRQLSPALVAAYETKFVDKNLLRQLLHQWAEDWEQAREANTE